MKRLVALSVIIALIFTSCQKQLSLEKFAEKIYNQYSKHQFMHYKLHLKYNYEGQPDTIPTPYEVWLMRVPEDTVIGGWVWIENYYRPYKLYYNLDSLYIIYPTKHKIRMYKDVFKPLITYCDWIGLFMHPDKFLKMYIHSKAQMTLTDTTINNSKYYKLTIKNDNPKHGPKKIYAEILIDQELKPYKIYTKTFYNTVTINRWLKFSDVDFNEFDTAQFRQQFEKYAKQFPPIPYNPQSTEDIIDRMLKIGEQAPDFVGENYITKEPFKLSDYKGKIVILDFWFMQCPPCVRAIPALSEIYEKYKDKGVEVFGINSIDNKPDEQNQVFFKFIKNVGMKYPAIKVESSVDRAYKIIAYPSLYILDREGKVAYIEVGFTNETKEELEKVIDSLLAQ